MRIPGPIFYVLAVVLIGFGAWRVIISRNPDRKAARYHLVWGALYVAVGVWLLLTQLGVFPAPRLGFGH